MTDVVSILNRQSAWQKARAGLTWEEKLRLASSLRRAAEAMRQSTDARRAAHKQEVCGDEGSG